jgi:hypothetical protein
VRTCSKPKIAGGDVSRWPAGLITLVATAFVSGCANLVSVPPRDQDAPPIITVSNFVVGGSGTVSHEIVTSGQPVSVSLGSVVMISVSAKNAGGVKRLDLSFTQGQKSVSVGASAAPDFSGKVPDLLAILGSNGAGQPGSQPIELVQSPATSRFPVPASIQVSAENFNGQQTSFVVIYNPFWRAPQIKSFVVNPNYINIGAESKLEWVIGDCAAYCSVRIEGRDGITFSDLVEAHANLGASGSLAVRPMRSTLTQYTLAASNPNNSNATPMTATVQLAPPSAPQQGMVFYFRMENSGSTVTPCFTMAIYGPDQGTAKQWAESQNGGYQATEISESQYSAGCP